MHEMSIAQSLLDIVRQHVEEDELQRVRELKVRVGEFAGVVPDSLEFCFQAMVAETSLRQCELRIERVPFRIRCNRCLNISPSENGFGICPNCGSVETVILSGKELQVVEIELEDNIPESA